jgi:hypothetical protein
LRIDVPRAPALGIPTDAVVGLALQGADGQTGTLVDRDGIEPF